MTHESEAEAAVHAFERFGRIDVVVNNAGFAVLGAVEEVSDAEVAAFLRGETGASDTRSFPETIAVSS